MRSTYPTWFQQTEPTLQNMSLKQNADAYLYRQEQLLMQDMKVDTSALDN